MQPVVPPENGRPAIRQKQNYDALEQQVGRRFTNDAPATFAYIGRTC